MESIYLIKAQEITKEQANDFKAEFFRNKEMVINGSALLDQLEYDEWIDRVNTNYVGGSEEWVTATTFFAKRTSDDHIVGIIDVRHTLGNTFLKEYGGHIGYAIRPSERRKGYATKMLKEALKYCKSLGLDKIMIGCYQDNTASNKVIIRCGGKIKESKMFTDHKPMNIYEIVI